MRLGGGRGDGLVAGSPAVLVAASALLGLARFLCDVRPGDAQAQKNEAILAMAELKHPERDCFPVAPVVGVNLQAPQRVILQAMEEMVREWKRERNIPERRRRADKLEDYLAAFDLREGRAGDRYDGAREKTLGQAAARRSTTPTDAPTDLTPGAGRHSLGVRDHAKALAALKWLDLVRAVEPGLAARVYGSEATREGVGGSGCKREGEESECDEGL